MKKMQIKCIYEKRSFMAYNDMINFYDLDLYG